ncbi:MAG: GTP-binding protein [Oscillospiraceae bacterium]|nr:GTP-binding protein [Oscillospiraceae bacterium]
MTAVDIYSGFLGAGKTTLIKKMISEAYAGQKVVLIENEFGEINVDSGFLKDSGVQITEMSSGCICCSLVGDFSESLKKVVAEYAPDRIIIEPSGVGKLSDVMNAVEKVAEDAPIYLNSFTAVVDIKKYSKYMKLFGEFFIDQIRSASVVVLSRTQDATDEEIEKCSDVLNEINHDALIVTTPWDDIDGKQILSVLENGADLQFEAEDWDQTELENYADMEDDDEHEHHHHHDHDHECGCHHDHDHDDHDHECGCHHDHDHDDHDHECGCHHDHHGHHADDVFTSCGIETAKKFTEDELRNILAAFSDSEKYGMIIRAKGMLPAKDGGWLHFDYVPDEYEVRKGTPDVTGRLCVIGTDINKEEIEALFKKLN